MSIGHIARRSITSRIIGTSALATAAIVVTGCASRRSSTNGPVASLAPTPTAQGGSTPTDTQAPPPSVGALVQPLPPGIRDITVTFVGDGLVYKRSIGDPQVISAIVADVDASTLDVGETQGCALQPVSSMQLTFAGPSGTANYLEQSGCARAMVTIGQNPPVEVDAWLTNDVEALIGVNFTLDESGHAVESSVTPTS